MPRVDDTLNRQHPPALGIGRVTSDLRGCSSVSLPACQSCRSPGPTAEKSPERRPPASPLSARGVERRERAPSARWPRCGRGGGSGEGGRGRAVRGAARGARGGSVASGPSPDGRARAGAGERASKRGGAGPGKEGCAPKRVPRSHPRRLRVLQAHPSKYWRPSPSLPAARLGGRIQIRGRAPRRSVAGSQVAPRGTWVPQAPQGVRQLRSRVRLPSPRFSLPSRPCLRRWVEGARRGALPLATHPQRVRGDAGQAPPQATSQILARSWDVCP